MLPDPSKDGEKITDCRPRYQPLVIVLVAVCLGILVDRYMPMPVFAWWAAAGGALGGWLALWRGNRPRIASFVLLLAISCTAGSWHHCRWYLFAEDDIGNFAQAREGPVCVEAVALAAPRVETPPAPDPMRMLPDETRSRLEIELTGIRDGEAFRNASGFAMLSMNGEPPDVQCGDRVRIFGQFAESAEPANPGEFDYAAQGRADRKRIRLRTTFGECVSVVEGGNWWSPSRIIDRARTSGSAILGRYLDRERAGLAAAVLLGAREQLDSEQTGAFMRTGTMHLLAISGLHVGILAGALFLLVRRLPIPRNWGLTAVAGIIVFYMLLTDARPPVIRATILVLVCCGALYLGRRHLVFNSLAAAALFVLASNPTDIFRTGPQLSFLAVAGLMWFVPSVIHNDQKDVDPLDRLIARTRGWFTRAVWGIGVGARRLFLVTAIVWLLLLPLIMARFHLFSPISLLVTPLAWAPMALGLIAGFGTLVFGAIVPPLGGVLGFLCDANLWVLQSTVESAADVPGGYYWVPGPPEWWLLGFYGGLTILAAVPKIRPPRRWCLAMLAGWIAIGFAASGHDRASEGLNCTFLAMGHGCATVVETPSGKTLLYDAGRLAAPDTACRSISGLLWSRGITHIDAVVISHGDVDHYNALPGLLERFSVGVVYVSPMMFQNENPALAALRESVAESGVEIRTLQAGDLLDCGPGCRAEVLHPPRRGVFGGDNANSIVLAVEHDGHDVLLTGDLNSPGLDDVLAEGPRHFDVILAPHHGSRRSNPPGLADWSTPDLVVISGSSRWDSRPVEEAYAAAGSDVLHTVRCGAVTARISEGRVEIERFRADR